MNDIGDTIHHCLKSKYFQNRASYFSDAFTKIFFEGDVKRVDFCISSKILWKSIWRWKRFLNMSERNQTFGMSVGVDFVTLETNSLSTSCCLQRFHKRLVISRTNCVSSDAREYTLFSVSSCVTICLCFVIKKEVGCSRRQ